MKKCGRCQEVKPLSDFYKFNFERGCGYQSRCIPCCKTGASEWAKANRSKINDRRRKPERALLTREEKLAKKRAMENLRYANNTAAIKSRVAEWKKDNRAKVRQSGAKRKAAKRRATPAWANPFFIDEIYELAYLRSAMTGVLHHVDHSVPLRHPLVCGLHVEHNLQVIPASENCSKQNRYWPDMPMTKDVFA